LLARSKGLSNVLLQLVGERWDLLHRPVSGCRIDPNQFLARSALLGLRAKVFVWRLRAPQGALSFSCWTTAYKKLAKAVKLLDSAR